MGDEKAALSCMWVCEGGCTGGDATPAGFLGRCRAGKADKVDVPSRGGVMRCEAARAGSFTAPALGVTHGTPPQARPPGSHCQSPTHAAPRRAPSHRCHACGREYGGRRGQGDRMLTCWSWLAHPSVCQPSLLLPLPSHSPSSLPRAARQARRHLLHVGACGAPLPLPQRRGRRLLCGPAGCGVVEVVENGVAQLQRQADRRLCMGRVDGGAQQDGGGGAPGSGMHALPAYTPGRALDAAQP